MANVHPDLIHIFKVNQTQLQFFLSSFICVIEVHQIYVAHKIEHIGSRSPLRTHLNFLIALLVGCTCVLHCTKQLWSNGDGNSV